MVAADVNEWAELAARWAHVVIAMTWIGTSIYFMRVDGSIRPPRRREDGAHGVVGELWSVHGGGVYHSQKYRVAPADAPPDRHVATPWPAWGTWISGFVLMIVFYYWNADAYLVDRSVADFSSGAAIAISIAMLAAGWLVYDAACRLLRDDRLVGAAVAGLTVLTAWASSELFAPRAAWLETGSVLGTIMSANVLVVIDRANRRLATSTEPREEDARLGAAAKQRSVHNSYLTPAVVLAMIGNHFPGVFGSRFGWELLVALMLIGAAVRHFFVEWHAGRRQWALPAASAAAFVAIMLLVASDRSSRASTPAPGSAALGKRLFRTVGCASCHTLADAGASGTVGPNLNAAKPSRGLVVERVSNGLGAMPSFRNRLSAAQIDALAVYVSEATR